VYIMNTMKMINYLQRMMITRINMFFSQLHIRIAKYSHFIPMSGVQWVNYMYFHRYTLGTFAIIVITIFYGKTLNLYFLNNEKYRYCIHAISAF